MPERREPIMRGDYELVGSPVAPLHLEIDITTADELRGFVANEVFPTVMHAASDREVVVPRLSEDQDVTKMATSFGRNPYYSPDLSIGGFFGLRLTHGADESWKLRTMKSRYRHDGTQNRIMVRYMIDVLGGQLMQAKRVVQIIRSRPDEVFAQLLMTDDEVEPLKPDYKMYERPMNSQDCDKLRERIVTGLNRKQVVGR